MGILFNGTEKTNIHSLDNFQLDEDTNEWTCSFYFHLFDNFGLDNNDLLNFQEFKFLGYDIGYNFTSWWILQHRRGYKPFRTEIRNVFHLKGDLDL